MRSRFLCYLLASVMLHLIVLALPFSVTMGGLGTRGTLPVRVHLLPGEAASPLEKADRDASSDAPSPATARQLSGKAQAQARTTNEKIEPAFDSIAETSPEHLPAAVRTRPTASKPEATRQSADVVSPATDLTNRKATRPGRRAETERHRKTTSEKQHVLRTTAVYPGSRGAEAPHPSEAGAGSATAGKSGSTAAEPGQRGSSRQAHADQSSHVRYARVVKPKYPEEARAQGWEGTTVLRVLVNQAGRSADIQVHRSSGFHLLDDAAVEALRLWEFHPARRGPLAVQSWVSVPIVFKLEEDK